MTAPERRRPLPALAFIGALSLLTALVWFRVLHRSDGTPPSTPSSSSSCPSAPASPTPTPSVLPVQGKVSVLVLNSTNRNGIATATTKVLRKAGFTVRRPADDSSSYGGHGVIKGVAEIRYAAQMLPSATLLSYYFPHARLTQTDAAGNTVIVALGAKFTKVPKAAVVHRQLRKHHVRLKPRRVRSKPVAASGC